MDTKEIILAISSLIGAAGGLSALWQWFVSRATAAKLTAEAGNVLQDAVEKEVSRLTGEIERLMDRVRSLDSRVEELETEVRVWRSKYDDLSRKYRDLLDKYQRLLAWVKEQGLGYEEGINDNSA